jgi:GTPase SAR1 family protein
MGNCIAGKGLTKEQRQALEQEYLKSKKIDQENLKDLERDVRVCKLLLLGAGESGKSTLFKQMVTIYGGGFTQKQLNQYHPSIHQNTFSSMRQLVEVSDTFPAADDTKVRDSALDAKKLVLSLAVDHCTITPDVGAAIKTLWADEGIRNTFKLRSKYQFLDTAGYFFDAIDRISHPHYEPTYTDVLRCRVRTTGIVETQFKLASHEFLLIDVGGQRNERKKWIHSFDGVTAVLFVASLSEFDQLLFEDNTTNRVVESLNLFEEICSTRWFLKSPIILFLNKRDLFEEKIKTVDMKQFFGDYEGAYDYTAGVEFITKKFLSRIGPKKPTQIYAHVTCATDTDNVAHVFNDVKDIIIRQSVDQSGLETTF